MKFKKIEMQLVVTKNEIAKAEEERVSMSA